MLQQAESTCLHGEDVVAAHALQDLGHVVQADAHAEVAVAAEVLKAVRAQLLWLQVSAHNSMGIMPEMGEMYHLHGDE